MPDADRAGRQLRLRRAAGRGPSSRLQTLPGSTKTSAGCPANSPSDWAIASPGPSAREFQARQWASKGLRGRAGGPLGRDHDLALPGVWLLTVPLAVTSAIVPIRFRRGAFHTRPVRAGLCCGVIMERSVKKCIDSLCWQLIIANPAGKTALKCCSAETRRSGVLPRNGLQWFVFLG